MNTEPKLIEIPGIPGKLREQNLDEFLAVLAPDHLARQQLNEIRNQALKSVELSTQLMQANEKVIELQGKLMSMSQPPIPVPQMQNTGTPLFPMPTVTISNSPAPFTEVDKTILGVSDQRSGPAPKAQCPHCKKMITTSPGGWSSHQRHSHPDNPAPLP